MAEHRIITHDESMEMQLRQHGAGTRAAILECVQRRNRRIINRRAAEIESEMKAMEAAARRQERRERFAAELNSLPTDEQISRVLNRSRRRRVRSEGDVYRERTGIDFDQTPGSISGVTMGQLNGIPSCGF
jgi:hypothetical protein